MEFRPYYMAREWVRQGHQVTIVAASHSHVRQQAPKFQGLVGEQLIDGIRYVWLKTLPYSGNSWRRALNMFAFVAQLFRCQLRVTGLDNVDTVIASSTYPFDIYPARRIARRHRAKLVFEVHDLWPLSPMELGGMSPRHPFIRLVQRAEDYAYHHADRVVSLLPCADTYMISRGMRPEKFAYVPNGVDVDEWRKPSVPLDAELQGKLHALRADNKFIVGYAGAFGLANALDSVIDAAALLREAPVAFALFGQGPENNRLRQRINELALPNVLVFPRISKRAIPSFLEQVDATIIGWKRCSLYRFGVSPNKLLDYMMAGKPVIHAIEAANDLVADSRCGISVAPENPRQIADAVAALMALSPEMRQRMGARGRAHVEQYHNYSILARRFIDVVDECDRRGSRPESSGFGRVDEAKLAA
jgi:glycosyltransferase involved in cell wall biosynthesis